jgi:YHS domain-containing protein
MEEARGKVKAFQSQAETTRQEIQARFQKFLPIAERIVAMVREKLEALRERVKFDATPSDVQTERFYSRSVTLDVKSELAGTVKLNFRLGHDSDVRNIMLDYNLEIIPVFFKYNAHARLDMPLEAFNEAAVSKWLDDCLIQFANDFLEMHATKQYQARVMVADPVAGISFPKYFAAATLEHGGTTHYFISEESRREFAKKHGLNP